MNRIFDSSGGVCLFQTTSTSQEHGLIGIGHKPDPCRLQSINFRFSRNSVRIKQWNEQWWNGSRSFRCFISKSIYLSQTTTVIEFPSQVCIRIDSVSIDKLMPRFTLLFAWSTPTIVRNTSFSGSAVQSWTASSGDCGLWSTCSAATQLRRRTAEPRHTLIVANHL